MLKSEGELLKEAIHNEELVDGVGLKEENDSLNDVVNELHLVQTSQIKFNLKDCKFNLAHRVG